MNINNANGSAHVTLSERNLRDLLRAYEANPLHCSLRRRCEDGTHLVVTIEPDAQHYGTRQPGPGYGNVDGKGNIIQAK